MTNRTRPEAGAIRVRRIEAWEVDVRYIPPPFHFAYQAPDLNRAEVRNLEEEDIY